jgi:FMN phosphatase YigB (HAD superfamily)
MKLRAIFFDVSGTLIDEASDEQAHLELIQALSVAYDLEGDIEVYREKFEEEFEQKYRAMIDADNFQTLGELHARAFRSLLDSGALRDKTRSKERGDISEIARLSNLLHARCARMFPSSLRVLKLCRDLGYHVGIISDFDTEPLHQILQKTGIAEICDSVTNSEEVRRYKPASIMFTTALEKASSKPTQAIYFGDRWERDIVGANKVGMYSCLIGYHRSQEPHPDYVIGTLDEAESLIRDQLH